MTDPDTATTTGADNTAERNNIAQRTDTAQPTDTAERTNTAQRTDIAEYALRLGDDALIEAQRLGEWVSNAPELEEDVALANIGLDLLGQARALLSYAGSILGRTEDELAYFRTDLEFRCSHLVAQPRGDFAVTVARMLVLAAYRSELYTRLADSADETVRGVAAKGVKEVSYHLRHARQWTVRLGDGTDESHRRMQGALDAIWPYVDELFRSDEIEQRLVAAGIAADSAALRAPVLETIADTVAEATLTVPELPAAAGGGRHGRPSEHLGHLLAEMQVLARQFPGANW